MLNRHLIPKAVHGYTYLSHHYTNPSWGSKTGHANISHSTSASTMNNITRQFIVLNYIAVKVLPGLASPQNIWGPARPTQDRQVLPGCPELRRHTRGGHRLHCHHTLLQWSAWGGTTFLQVICLCYVSCDCVTTVCSLTHTEGVAFFLMFPLPALWGDSVVFAAKSSLTDFHYVIQSAVVVISWATNQSVHLHQMTVYN